MQLFTKLVFVTSSMSLVFGQSSISNIFGPVKTIIDTDIGPWADDVGTLAMLYNYMDMNLISIQAIVGNNAYENQAAVIDLMNTYFHHPDIPIGITKDPGAVVNKGSLGWIEYATANFPHPKYNTSDQAEDAVRVYRRVLSNAPDRSITITSIGYLTNIVNLLNSKADDISSMSGTQLVRRKVRNMIAMAGEYPSGSETNIIGRPLEVMEFLRKWSLPITFVGSEIGNKLKCGANLINPKTNQTYFPNSPVGVMYELSFDVYGLDGCYDHSTAIILAKGFGSLFKPMYGNVYVNETGFDYWRGSFLNIWSTRNHVEILDQSKILGEINSMMVKRTTKKAGQ